MHASKTNPSTKSIFQQPSRTFEKGKDTSQKQENSHENAVEGKNTEGSHHDFSRIPVFADNKIFIQPKLTINTPGDVYEQEADRMAERVMNLSDTSTASNPHISLQNDAIQRKCAECEKDEKKEGTLMRKAENRSGFEASSRLVSQLNTTKGSGSPLSEQTRSFMEKSFGSDFSGVRVHIDSRAGEMNRGIQARAFTYGNNVYFREGEYKPETAEGKRLLAHELTHTIQQTRLNSPNIQKADYGGISSGAPPNWSTQVANATTPTAKANLIQTALGSSITVSDRTTQSSSDASPDSAHLLPFTAASAAVNFDDNLNSKTARNGGRSLSPNAGYTFTDRGVNYVVLGNKALDNDYYKTVFLLNHELDHVRQNIAGSTLSGNASELDAWTSSFIREFHRMYNIRDNGTTCFVQDYETFNVLIGHYERATAPEQQTSCARIVAYFNSVIQSHAAHLLVFRFWIRRTLGNSQHLLVEHLNTQLNLGINVSDAIGGYRQFPCTGITNLSFPAAPTPATPQFPASTSAPAPSTSTSAPTKKP